MNPKLSTLKPVPKLSIPKPYTQNPKPLNSIHPDLVGYPGPKEVCLSFVVGLYIPEEVKNYLLSYFVDSKP